MSDYFIKHISIKDCQYIGNLEVPLSDTQRKHLIITGKNGSGKTTTLKEINILLNKLINDDFAIMENYKNVIEGNKSNIKAWKKQIAEGQKKIEDLQKPMENLQKQIVDWQKIIADFEKVTLIFSGDDDVYTHIVNGDFILTYFEAKRENIPTVPDAIKNITINKKNKTDTNNIHKQFIAYMVRLRNTLLNERFDGSSEKVEKIERWFENFENALKNLFQEDDLKLKYYDEVLNFKIAYGDREFGLNELSDGYSSLLAIITELMLRMEAYRAYSVISYDMQGVVLIDEIETHLHVDLQKKVLPFLVDFFPKIQFIVTTHSPFVLSSLSNAVICDLEKNIITEDLSAYSYDALIESYFDSDKYSQKIKDKITVYENLSNQSTLTQDEENKLHSLSKYFNDIPKFMADELAVKVNEIKLKSLVKDR